MPGTLLALAAYEGVIVRYCDLPADILGVYYRRCPYSVIMLHKKIEHRQRLTRCILAEELGHHFTCGANIIAFARSAPYHVEKIERMAAWWAVQYLVPFDGLVQAVLREHARTTHELAEHFDVTERFMATSLRLYRDKKPGAMCRLIRAARLRPENLV